MSCRLGLSIGESFAELQSFSADGSKSVFQSRWYLPKKALADGLREALKSLEADEFELRVATRTAERAISRGLGKSPALLVTSGFERWLELQQPLTSPLFSPKGTRAPLKAPSDFIFPISARVGADGSEVAPLTTEDLEFLAAKFELMKVKVVAIALLNATKNPEHENRAASYLRDKGFRVVTSHSLNVSREADRWRETLEVAYAESTVSEERTQIDEMIAALPGTWTPKIWTREGLKDWSSFEASQTRGGLERALQAQASSTLIFHFGLDHFGLFHGDRAETLASGATQLVRHGLWPFPHFSEENSGYEPGPMLFGKSHQLAAVDILHLGERLQEVEGFTPLISEKSRARILETLFTLAKAPTNDDRRRPPDAREIARDLEQAFVERIASEILMTGEKKSVTITGAFAPSLQPLLKSRLPKTMKIEFSKERAPWFESAAIADTIATSNLKSGAKA